MKSRWIVGLFTAFLLAGCTCQIGNTSNNGDESGTSPKPKPENNGTKDPSQPNNSDNPGEEEEACMSTERFFMRKVWAQVAQPTCVACHNGQGLASISNMLLNRELGFGDQLGPNMAAMASMATKKHAGHDNQSHLLLKVTNTLPHGGGQILTPDSPEFNILKEFVARTQQPTDCPTPTESDPFENIIGLEPQDLFRKVAISVGGRLPTQQEITTITTDGEPALQAALDKLLNEAGFYERLKDGFNDVFLTDAHLVQSPHFQLDSKHYPDWDWHAHLGLNNDDSWQFYQNIRHGIAREPMELIAHIAKNDRPFTDILTADYIMVNPYSAKTYGVADKVQFNNPEDRYEFKPVTLPVTELEDYVPNKPASRGQNYPHAGVLSSYMLLARHQSTETNRNRGRASFFFSTFLAIDILELAARSNNPLESVLEHENPIRDATACAICHVTMDPVAGAFQYHNDIGRYRPHWRGFYKDTFPPGMHDEQLPDAQVWEGLRWLGQKTAKDPRFALAMTEHVFFIVTGQRPLDLPKGPNTQDYETRLTTYATQREFLRKTAQEFTDSNFNIKKPFKSVILSSYYRAAKIDPAFLTPKRAVELANIGNAYPLQPEQLHRKIIAVFGKPWKSVWADGMGEHFYKYLYGGIDSLTMTQRLTEPNGVMAAVADLMANEVACHNTALDFSRPKDQRLLFPETEITDLPGTNPQADERIKKNIQYLHNRLLGKRLDIDDPEITRTFNLLKDVMAKGVEDIKEKRTNNWIIWMCNADGISNDPEYIVRGWMAVLTYLMSTYDFLYN